VDVPGGNESALAVVFVHGLAGNAGHWEAQLRHLSTSRRAVAIELRGHGGSAAPAKGDYALEALAEDVAAGVDALGLGRFVLVGHSIGGGVALAYAAAHPERVAGLFLVDPMSDARPLPAADKEAFLASLDSPAYAQVIRESWLEMAGEVPTVRERLLCDLEAMPRQVVVGIQRARMCFDPVTALARFPGPVFSLVLPTNDTPRSVHRLRAGIPHRVVPGTGHWVQLERPDDVDRALDEFLVSSSQTSTGVPMYTLYYSPGAASMLVHWLLLELHQPLELRLVDTAAGQQKRPEYLALNPNGVVPTLLIDGKPHYEAAALLLYLADRHAEAGLAPAPGSASRMAYYQWVLNLANAVQPLFRQWWYPHEPAGEAQVEAVRAAVTVRIEAAWQRIDAHLAANGPHLLGDTLSAADFYLVMLMRWSRNMPKPATAWPHLAALATRLKARPSFATLYQREGLSEWA
jgi:glutathione S-transferase